MQRVVSGRLGGRKLLPLPRSVTGVRPSSGRVRGAIFNRLQREVVGARVLDLFAGSGALAIEALSRGASHATLVEQQSGLARFLDRQLEALDLEAITRVVRDDARRFLDRQGPSATPFDLVLVDPPYAELNLYGEVLDRLLAGAWLAPSATVVIEYQKRRGQRPELAIPRRLVSEAVRDHGQTALEFFSLREPS